MSTAAVLSRQASESKNETDAVGITAAATPLNTNSRSAGTRDTSRSACLKMDLLVRSSLPWPGKVPRSPA